MTRGTTSSVTEGFHKERSGSVRLLYTGNVDECCGALERKPQSKRGGDQARYFRKPLPMHRILKNHQSHPGRGKESRRLVHLRWIDAEIKEEGVFPDGHELEYKERFQHENRHTNGNSIDRFDRFSDHFKSQNGHFSRQNPTKCRAKLLIQFPKHRFSC